MIAHHFKKSNEILIIITFFTPIKSKASTIYL